MFKVRDRMKLKKQTKEMQRVFPSILILSSWETFRLC
jgi:hypothetical protein